jgi:predicted helicase
LEWVLDQHKERTPRDPTVRERRNAYRFANHKEQVIDLLMRVTRVSVETMTIIAAMRSTTNARQDRKGYQRIAP